MSPWTAPVQGPQLDRFLRPRAEQLASLEAAQRAAGVGPGASSVSNPRAEFWRLRGLRRGAKKSAQRSREDLSALTRQGHYPPYERVVLREGGWPRAPPGVTASGPSPPSPQRLGSVGGTNRPPRHWEAEISGQPGLQFRDTRAAQ